MLIKNIQNIKNPGFDPQRKNPREKCLIVDIEEDFAGCVVLIHFSFF